MVYFYAYLSNINEEYKQRDVSYFSKSHVYIDKEEKETKWTELLSILKEGDELYIPNMDSLSPKYSSIKKRLEELENFHIKLVINQKHIDTRILLDFYEFLNNSKRKTAKELQRKGIEKALEKKYKGEGNFGRPKIEKPKDFKENLLKIMHKKNSHDTYRAQLGMKRSTYYKMVKEEKESWTKE